MAFSKTRPASICVHMTHNEKAKLRRYAIAAGVSVPTLIREYVSRLPNYWYIHLEDEHPENQEIRA